MKLLLAVDSITTLNILLDEVAMRSWPNGTQAHVVSVVEDGAVPLETWRREGYGRDAVRHEMRRRGEQITALSVERLRALGIAGEVTIMRGDPGFLVPFAARKWSSDLILIRANNRVDFRNWLLGSVARRVFESAPCSVEVVRVADEPHVAGGRFRVLLATDGSDASLNAAHMVAESNWPEMTEVKVVSVVNPVTYSLEDSGLWRDKHTARAHRAIGEALKVLGTAPVKISGEVITGGIARGILDRARNWPVDLIVVVAHDRHGLKRLLRGSISSTVASRAHCSVRVVRGGGVSRKETLPRAQSSRRKVDQGHGLRRAA